MTISFEFDRSGPRDLARALTGSNSETVGHPSFSKGQVTRFNDQRVKKTGGQALGTGRGRGPLPASRSRSGQVKAKDKAKRQVAAVASSWGLPDRVHRIATNRNETRENRVRGESEAMASRSGRGRRRLDSDWFTENSLSLLIAEAPWASGGGSSLEGARLFEKLSGVVLDAIRAAGRFEGIGLGLLQSGLSSDGPSNRPGVGA